MKRHHLQPILWAKEALEKPEQEFFVDWLQDRIDEITHRKYKDDFTDGKLDAYLQVRWELKTGGFNRSRIPTAIRLTRQSLRLYISYIVGKLVDLCYNIVSEDWLRSEHFRRSNRGRQPDPDGGSA